MADKPLLINYNQLQSLWLSWLSQPKHILFDRWLSREAADWRRSNRESLPLELSQAMNEAMRYQQLACALELIHIRGMDNIDWLAWDDKWRDEHAEDMERNYFWFWVQKRSQSRWYIPNDWQSGNRPKTVEAVKEAIEQAPLSPLWMIWHGLRPQWLPHLQRRAELSGWSEQQLTRFITMQNQRPPLWLRVYPNANNGLSHDAYLDKLLAALTTEGVSAQKNQHGLCATGGFGISQTQAYKTGAIEIQDLASQQIANAIEAHPGNKIWDACAGAGGKSLAMASQMNGKGAVIATDLYQRKLDELKKRAKRAEQLNIRSFVWDGEAPLRLPAEISRQQGFDKVLLDAPCSATGTWRRNTDARWRLDPKAPDTLSELQQRLLSFASQAVRPGGVLMYVTCSWLEAENETIIEHFMANHSGFELAEMKLVGAPNLDSDTLFYARMIKTA
ncbi:MAG: RsmB/NOP family class I SAM-dependent RNA methyltransferase [Oleibacter sp.]|nr:RsmB/NOP family class I SAM-dependent RNA methyltransferase [Thalassolituus sp.]